MRKFRKIKKIYNRYTVLFLIMTILFSVLIGSLVYLQIVKGKSYADTANTKLTKLISIKAPRGIITDENGIRLADNVQSYNITYNLMYAYTEKKYDKIFSTLNKTFKILDQNGESQKDSFILKTNPCRFEINSSNPKDIQSIQLKFLKDRGFQDPIRKKKFTGKKESELNSEQKDELNDELLKLTPEYVYNKLLKKYDIVKGISKLNIKYSNDDIRRYLIVIDELAMNNFSEYKSVDIASNVKKDTALIFMQRSSELPGLNVENSSMREYPYGSLASPVIGYISRISSNNEEKYEEKGYDTSSDYIGQSGIESAMEGKLKGNDGGKIVEVNQAGSITKNLATREAEPGNNVKLTLDANLQYTTEQSLNDNLTKIRKQGKVGNDQITTNATRGAAVVIDVNTGGVLALASIPSFNPNDFSSPSGLTDEQNKKYFNPDYESMGKALNLSQSQIDDRFPLDKSIKGNTTIRKDMYDFFPKYLYNYATMSLIPSGSTFKPLTAIAALESGVITPEYTYEDQGNFDIGGGQIDTFKSDGVLGVLNVEQAIIRSSNPFFMNAGKLLKSKYGDNALAKFAWQFGLGSDPNSKDSDVSNTGVEIPENFGQVYNSYSQKNLSSRQYLMNIEADLKSGVSSLGGKLPIIDLYDNNSDSKAVADIKSKIRSNIKNTIKDGKFSAKDYKNLFKELINEDTQYSNKNISDAQLLAIVEEIRYQALQTGYGSLKLPYNMYFASIGQGMDNFTPLQIANYIATIANGGTRYKVHLVDSVTDSTGKVILKNNPVVLNKVNMSTKTRQIVMAGMEGVTGAGGADGTAAEAFSGFKIATGGKTGTAQFNDPDKQTKEGRADYAWYVGFAPADNPKIAVAVVLFDGGYGSQAAYVAKGIYEEYFKDELQKSNYPFDVDLNIKPEN
ncbi:MAG: penicillin-binding transpeptidase domain-containing protein [Clostridium sp.]|nr:penicillin-binding transpeptidase domain-containing protein [Clostridium sp.]